MKKRQMNNPQTQEQPKDYLIRYHSSINTYDIIAFDDLLQFEQLAKDIPPAVIKQAIHRLLQSLQEHILDGRTRTTADDDQ